MPRPTNRRTFLSGATALAGSSWISTEALAASLQAGEERFTVRHEAVVQEIPTGAALARIWLAAPRDDAAQTVTRLRLSGDRPGKVVTGGSFDNRAAYYEVVNPPPKLRVALEFDLTRRPVHRKPVAAAVMPLPESRRSEFAVHLQPNRYVPVGGKFKDLALSAVGSATNPVDQAQRLYDWVLGYVEYWQKDPKTLKPSANGESEYCLGSRTGNCTDFHSLLMSLSRSIGIPTRMVYGGFLQGEGTPVPGRPSMDGKDVDSGYHCWVESYFHGLGWCPIDVALADLLTGHSKQQFYFGNLEARRLTWSYGRDVTLGPRQSTGPLNAFYKVHVEVDGQLHTAWERKFTFASQSVR